MMSAGFLRLMSLCGIDASQAFELVQRLGWALLHSLWQFTVISCLLAIVLKMLGRRSAQGRYVASTVALAAMTLLLPLTFALIRPERAPSVSVPRVDRVDVVSTDRVAEKQVLKGPRETFVPDRGESRQHLPNRTITFAKIEPELSGENPRDTAVAAATINESRGEAWWSRGRLEMLHEKVTPWLDTMVACWGCGVLLFSFRLSIGWLALRRLRNRGIEEVPPELRSLASEVASKLGLKRAVRVVHSKLVEVPAAIGWLAPVVLLPISLTAGVTPQELQAILAHELAHIRRHDFLVNLLQMVAETLFFYHPGVWWVSTRMRQLCEDCCDDLAVQVQGDRAAYARALLLIDELRVAAPRPALLFSGGVLLARIRRVMGVKNDSALSPAWAVPPMLLLGLLVLSAWFALSAGRTEQVAAKEAKHTPVLIPTVVMLDEREKPVVGHIALGRVGYSPDALKLPNWSTDRNLEIQLTELKEGTHTLVAQPSSPNATIFKLKIPAQERLFKQQLRPFLDWYHVRQRDFPEIRVSAEEKEPLRAFIILELTNSSDAPFHVSEADVKVVDASNLRAFLPSGALVGEKVVPPHSTRVLRISWTEIVKRGVWTSSSHEDWDRKGGPTVGDSDDKDRNHVRVYFGSHGTLPILLPKPERVLEYAEPPPVQIREFPLGHTGRFRVQSKPLRPAPATPPAENTDVGWLDAEHGLQYRFITPDHPPDKAGVRSLARGELPFFYLDLRNVGKGVALDLAIAPTQSQQRLIVDGASYTRHEPWGGIDPLPVGGVAIRFPFVLSSDWKNESNKTDSLQLADGLHRVSVGLSLKVFEDLEPLAGSTYRGFKPRESRWLLTRPLELLVDASRKPMEQELVMANLRRELEAFPRFHSPTASPNLRRLAIEGRPASTDLLISLIGDSRPQDPDPASIILASVWDNLNHSERERYLKANMVQYVHQRATYPAGVDAGISVGVRFRSDYAGLPKEKQITSETVTTHFLDGKRIGEPFRYPLHSTISHWYRTRELSVGRHTIRWVTDYTFKEGNETYSGHLESPEHSFEIVTADAPDTLAAAKSKKLDDQVQGSLRITEVIDRRDDSDPYFRKHRPPTPQADLWKPQMRWRVNRPDEVQLHLPCWRIREPLPVDLCFQVDLQIAGTKITIPCSELTAYAGKITSPVVRMRLIYDPTKKEHSPKAIPTPAKSPAAPPAKPEDGKPGATKSEPRRSLSGKMLVVGKPPERTLVPQAKDAPYYRDMKIYSEKIVVGPNQGLANVFVWLRSVNRDEQLTGPAKAVSTKSAVISISKGRLAPHALAVSAGQELKFQNQQARPADVSIDSPTNKAFHMLDPSTGKGTVTLTTQA